MERQVDEFVVENHVVCLKTNKRFSIGQASDDTALNYNVNYIVNGVYKKKKDKLILRLAFDNSKPIESIKLSLTDDPQYQFSGTWKVKKSVTTVNVSYQGEQAYYQYGCGTTFGF